MAEEEKSFWDKAGDALSEGAGDLVEVGKAYYGARQAESEADQKASEQATVSEQARIQRMQQQQQAKVAIQQQDKWLIAGGVALLLIVLLLAFTRRRR